MLKNLGVLFLGGLFFISTYSFASREPHCAHVLKIKIEQKPIFFLNEAKKSITWRRLNVGSIREEVNKPQWKGAVVSAVLAHGIDFQIDLPAPLEALKMLSSLADSTEGWSFSPFSVEQEAPPVGQIFVLIRTGELKHYLPLMYLGEGLFMSTDWAGTLLNFEKNFGDSELFLARHPKLKVNSKNSKAPVISYDDYADGWQESYDRQLSRKRGNSNTLSGALYERFEAGDPELTYVQRLGFSFQHGNMWSPTLDDLINKFHQEMKIAVRERGLYSTDVIHPARVFMDWRGNEFFVKWGDPIDPSWFEVDPTVLAPKTITRMLGLRLMVLSIVRAFHDSWHYSAFAKYPTEYVQPLLALLEYLGTSDCPVSIPAKSTRIFYAFECLALVPRENETKLRSLLSEPLQTSKDRLVTVPELVEYFKTKEYDKFIVPHARELLNRYRSVLHIYGGGARDPNIAWKTNSFRLRETPIGLAERLEYWLNFGLAGHEGDPDPAQESLLKLHGTPRQVVINLLARLEVFLLESTRVEARAFLEGLKIPNPPRESSIYRLFIASRVFENLDGNASEYPYAPEDSLTYSLSPPKPK